MAYWLFSGEGVAFIENEREYRLFVASNFVIGEFTGARSRWVCFLNQGFKAVPFPLRLHKRVTVLHSDLRVVNESL